MKKLTILLVILYFTMISHSSAYFEDKFFCKINNNKINIALKSNTGYKRCLDYYSILTSQLNETNKNIEKARKFIIIKEEVEYWQGIEKELITKQSNLTLLLNNLDGSIKEFEKNLFLKVKVLLNYYLKSENEKLNIQYTNTRIQINNAKYDGNINEFKKQILIFEKIQLKRSILQKIFICSDFDELMPMLKIWIDFENYKKIS